MLMITKVKRVSSKVDVDLVIRMTYLVVKTDSVVVGTKI